MEAPSLVPISAGSIILGRRLSAYTSFFFNGETHAWQCTPARVFFSLAFFFFHGIYSIR